MSEHIERVMAYEALDSRGRPTVACVVGTSSGHEGHASVPSGASKGTYEVLESRDGGDRYSGYGVRTAVANVNTVLGPAVTGMAVDDQEAVDRVLVECDGSDNLERLGANAVLSVSIATALASASCTRIPAYRLFCEQHTGHELPLLPMPMVNIISGGAHAAGTIDIQDLLIVPVGAGSFSQALEWASRVRAATAGVMTHHGLDATLVADEGGLAAGFGTSVKALEVLCAGMEAAGLVPGVQVAIAIDVAATQFWSGDSYRLAAEGRTVTAQDLVAEIEGWCRRFPIVSIEDAAADTDHDGWKLISASLRDRVQLVGDDLFVTDEARVEQGIRHSIANCVLVKPNQTGTLSRAWRVVELARRHHYRTILSARSGDTEDAWLADLACGWRSGQIKVGSTMRSERNAKWNRLLRIEAELGGPEKAPFAAGAVGAIS